MIQQVASAGLALALLVQLSAHSAGAFPALFSRGPLFRRTNGQQQQQARLHEQLMPLANAPVAFQQQQQQQSPVPFGQFQPAELMRLSSLQPAPLSAHPLQAASNEALSEQHAAAFFRPQLIQAADPRFQPTASFDLYDNGNQAYLEQADVGATSQTARQGPQMFVQRGQQQQQQQLNSQKTPGESVEPTHMSQVVDKIEQHIEHQIERGLEDDHQHHQHHQQQQHDKPRQAAASGYHQQQGAAMEEQQKGGEEAEEGALEEKAGKRVESSEPEVKQEQENQSEHQHEHPPEAFEIHHKKGGKSFQYFHQGHSS